MITLNHGKCESCNKALHSSDCMKLPALVRVTCAHCSYQSWRLFVRDEKNAAAAGDAALHCYATIIKNQVAKTCSCAMVNCDTCGEVSECERGMCAACNNLINQMEV